MDKSSVNLLDLIGRDTVLKKAATTGNGEYHGACPFSLILWYNKPVNLMQTSEGVTSTCARSNHRKGTSNPMDTPDSTPTKRCSKCGAEHPATTQYFYAQAKGKFGVRSRCIACTLSDNAEWEKKNPEARKAIQKRVNVKRADKMRDYGKEYRAKNAERERDRKRIYRLENAAKITLYNIGYNATHKAYKSGLYQAWVINNPEKARTNWRKRDDRVLLAEGTHTADDVNRIYEDQNGMCAYCGIRVCDEYHVDHVHPLALGGTNWPDNLAIACPYCNLSKGDRLLSDWQEVRGW